MKYVKFVCTQCGEQEELFFKAYVDKRGVLSEYIDTVCISGKHEAWCGECEEEVELVGIEDLLEDFKSNPS